MPFGVIQAKRLVAYLVPNIMIRAPRKTVYKRQEIKSKRKVFPIMKAWHWNLTALHFKRTARPRSPHYSLGCQFKNITTYLSTKTLVQRFGENRRHQSTHVHHQWHYSNSLLADKWEQSINIMTHGECILDSHHVFSRNGVSFQFDTFQPRLLFSRKW